MKINEEIVIHDELNPAIWDGMELKEDVHDAILEVVNTFLEDLEIPLVPVDIVIVGSNASYNYTDNSDLDIHIIANYELLDASPEIAQALYNSARSNFNSTYDITIKGINTEVYVEDINTSAISNGIYSVANDRWIKRPEKLEVPDVDLEPELSEIMDQVTDALASNDLETIEDAVNAIYLVRKNSMAADGEFGKGNLIFKEIRNSGLLDDMKNAIHQLRSAELSLESNSLPFNYNKSDLNESYPWLIDDNDPVLYQVMFKVAVPGSTPYTLADIRSSVTNAIENETNATLYKSGTSDIINIERIY